MEGWDFMSKLIQAGRALLLEAKFETLSDARSVNYCRPSSLFVVPCALSTLFCILCPLVILISWGLKKQFANHDWEKFGAKVWMENSLKMFLVHNLTLVLTKSFQSSSCYSYPRFNWELEYQQEGEQWFKIWQQQTIIWSPQASSVENVQNERFRSSVTYFSVQVLGCAHIIQESPLPTAADFNGSRLLLRFTNREDQYQYIRADTTKRSVNTQELKLEL